MRVQNDPTVIDGIYFHTFGWNNQPVFNSSCISIGDTTQVTGRNSARTSGGSRGISCGIIS